MVVRVTQNDAAARARAMDEAHARKGKCCIWPVEKMEIYFPKIGFVDCKMPGSYTPLSYSVWRSIMECSFPCMQEKGNTACGLLKKGKFIFQH